MGVLDEIQAWADDVEDPGDIILTHGDRKLNPRMVVDEIRSQTPLGKFLVAMIHENGVDEVLSPKDAPEE